MSKAAARTVRLFLVDGSPTGLITAEIMNWTGHILIAPRQNIGDALKREETGRTGVYFLVGEDPEKPTKQRVYIGEGDCVADRIKNHSKDESKDFWTKACFVTSKDQNITKAHVRYLEGKLVELTKQAGRANLANGTEPGTKSLPESDIADMEFFLEQIQLILPVVGFDFLRPTEHLPLVPNTSAEQIGKPLSQLELSIASRKHGLEAAAILSGDDFRVLAGSGALTEEFAQNSYGPLRQQLRSDGRLKPGPNPQMLQFVESVSFVSPSAAASVIFNRNANGRKTWRIKGTDQTLKEWQDAQIPIDQDSD